MPTINQLPLLTTASGGDQVPVYSPNNGDARRLPLSALVDFVEQSMTTVNSLEISTGNLSFTNTAQRITGDLSNATESLRLLVQSSTTNGNTNLGIVPNGNATTGAVRVHGGSDVANSVVGQLSAVGTTEVRLAADKSGTAAYTRMAFYTNNAERMRINTAGNVIVGNADSIGGQMSVWNGLFVGANDSSAEIQNYRASDSSGGSFAYLNKARGTIPLPTLVGAGDDLGSVIWRGYDGVGYRQAAQIIAQVDGTPSAGDMPGRLVFFTTPDGTVTGQERMRITQAGNVGIGESAPDYKLDVNGSFGFTPGSSVTPVDNGDVVIEATDNTTLTFKLKGSDGTVRSGTITLSP